ncbi:MAG: pantetheine-phosphate adenylyltransferase [Bacteroides sp.]|nr:pantetheine-phosphate adenylyltransferase [Bacteroides sp.]MCM1085046.1 pantetheine-phosphate adenylyltransferase [Bacteroides sp.]
MERIAVFPGSFDPFTNGHADLVRRALPLFDHIVVGIGINGEKRGMFPVEVRKACIEAVFSGESRVSVETFDTLTVDFCQKTGARFILRGLRSSFDWEYEKSIAGANRQLMPGIETVFLAADPTVECVSSSVVRDILRYRKDISAFVPREVARIIGDYLQNA